MTRAQQPSSCSLPLGKLVSFGLFVVLVGTLTTPRPLQVAEAARCFGEWCWEDPASYEYKVTSTQQNWASSKTLCEAESATLAFPSVYARNAILASGKSAAWSDVTFQNGGQVPVYSTDTTKVANLSVWKPNKASKQSGGCAALVSSNDSVHFSDCASKQYALCQRPGTPTKWTQAAGNTLEYGLFTRPANYTDALKQCEQNGGALAYIPKKDLYGVAIEKLVAATAYSSTLWMWSGYNEMKTETWASFFGRKAKVFYDPIQLPAGYDCAAVNGDLLTFRAQYCNSSLPFVCSRFSVPKQHICLNPGKTIQYHYLPGPNASDSNQSPANLYGGMSPTQAVTRCAALGGLVTKYTKPTELFDCFGDSAVESLVSSFETDDTKKYWVDKTTTTTIPSIFSDADLTTRANRRKCFWVNLTSPVSNTVDTFTVTSSSCGAIMPTICEVGVTSNIDVVLNNTEGFLMASECKTTAFAFASRPLGAGQKIELCPTGIRTSWTMGCFTFTEGMSVATAQFSFTELATGNVTMNLQATCVPVAICGTMPTSLVVQRQGAQNVNVLLDGTPQTAFPGALSGSLGIKLPVTSISINAIGELLPWPAQNITLALTQKVEADLCSVTPQQLAVTPGGGIKEFSIFCTGGSNATTFTVTLSTTGSPAPSAKLATCAVKDVTDLAIFRVSMKTAHTILLPTAIDFYPYGRSSFGKMSFSAIPGAPVGSTSMVCIQPKTFSVSGITSYWACLYSDDTGTGGWSYRSIELWTTNYNALTSRMTMTVTTFGSAKSQYRLNGTTAEVPLVLKKYNATISGLEPIEYQNNEIELVVSIPYPVPNGETLLVNIRWDLPASCSGLGIKQIQFGGGQVSGTTATYKPTPACVINGTLWATLDGSLRHVFATNVVNPNVVIFAPSALVVVKPPRYMYLNAAPLPVTVSTPIAPVGTEYTVVEPVVKGYSNTPVSWSPTRLLWNHSANPPRDQQFFFTAKAFVLNLTVEWSVSASTSSQFLAPAPFSFAVLNQSQVTFRMETLQYTFVNATYNIYVTVQHLPFTTYYNMQAIVDPSVSWLLSNQSAVFSNGSAYTATLRFKFIRMPPEGKTSYSIPVVLSDLGAGGYFPSRANVTASNILEPLSIKAVLPTFLLFGGDGVQWEQTNKKNMTFTISGPPRISKNITVEITASPSLSIIGTVFWNMGTRGSVNVTVKSQAVDPLASVSFRVHSYSVTGQDTQEGGAVFPATGIIPVRSTTTISVWPGTDNRISVRAGRSVTTSIAVTELPSPGAGHVTVLFTGATISNYVRFDPPNATFTADSPSLTIPIVITGLNAVRGVLLGFALVGPAAVQYELPVQIAQITVIRSLRIEPHFPAAAIAGQDNMAGELRLEALPESGTVLFLTVNCTNCPPDHLDISPVNFTWTRHSSLGQQIVFRALAPMSEVALISVSAASGSNATGYAPIVAHVHVRNPSPVSISYPQGRWYGGEQPPIQINVTNAVLNNASRLVFSTDAQISPICPIEDFGNGTRRQPCFVAPSALEFGPNTPVVQQFLVNTNAKALEPVNFLFKITYGGAAVPEYNFTGTVLNGSLTVRPKRWIRIKNMPPRFYAGFDTILILEIQENPDPYQQLVIETMNEPGLSTVGFPAAWRGSPNTTFDTPQTHNLTVKLQMGVSKFGLVIQATSSPQQVLRYLPPPVTAVTVMEKVELHVGTARIHSTQVLGSLNNQSYVVTLSRAPLETTRATPVYTSAVPMLLTFEPEYILWYPNSTTADLSVRMYVYGNSPGPAIDLRFELEGLSEELMYAVSPVYVPRLTISNRHTVYFTTSSDPLYVGTANSRLVNVSVSSPGWKTLIVKLGYGIPSAVTIEPSMLVFQAQAGQMWQTARLTGIRETFLSSDVNVSIMEGTEYEKVVRLSSVPNQTETGFIVFGLLQVKIDNNLGGVIAPGQNMSIRTDRQYYWQIQLEGTLDGRNVSYGLAVSKKASIETPHFFRTSPAEFKFVVGGALFYDFVVEAGAIEPFGVNVSIVPPASPIAQSGYWFLVNVVPDLEVNVTGFPSQLVVGKGNTKSFYVQPHRAPLPGEPISLAAEALCDSSIARIDQNGPALRWIEGRDPLPVTLVGVSPGSCDVMIRKQDYNKIMPLVSTFTTKSVTILPDPQIGWSDISTLNRSLTFREARREEQIFEIFVDHITFLSEFNYTVRDPSLPPALQKESEESYGVVIHTNKLIAQEPMGFRRMMEHGNNRDKFQFDTDTENPNKLTLTMGPFDELLLLTPETVTIEFQRWAFDGLTAPGVNNSINITVSEYVPSIVSATDEWIAQGSMLAAFGVGLYFAPPLALQGSKTYNLLLSFGCPNENWLDKQDNLGLMQTAVPYQFSIGSKEDLGRWLAVAIVNLAACLLVFVFHFFICLGYYIQRRMGSSRSLIDICGKMRFPSLSFLPLFVLVQPTMESCVRVILYSPDVGYRVAAFLIGLIPLVLFTAGIHGVVWRNESLIWRERRFPDGTSKVKKLFLPIGEWIHPTNSSYVKRFGMLFQHQRNNFRWYFLFEYLVAMFLGATNAIEPNINRGCVAKAGTMTGVLLLQTVAVILWMPFRVRFLNFAFILVYLMQSIAMIIVTQETSKRIRNDLLQKAAVRLILASSIVWIVCGLTMLIAGAVNILLRHYGLAGETDEGDSNEKPLLMGEADFEMSQFGSKERDLGQQAQVRIDDSDDEDETGAATLVALERELSERQPLGIFRSTSRRKAPASAFSPLRKKAIESEGRLLAQEKAYRRDEGQEVLDPESVFFEGVRPPKPQDTLDHHAWLTGETEEARQLREEEETRQERLRMMSAKPKLRFVEERIPTPPSSDED